MRVLVLADAFFSSREGSLLSRLQVGLADEGVRVIHAVPRGTKTQTGSGVYSLVLNYSPKTLSLLRPLAVKRLLRDLAAADSKDEVAEIDVVHVFGGSAWRLGADLAAAVGAGLALEVWRAGLVERARSIRMSNDELPLLIAPDPAIAKALLSNAGATGGAEATVRTAPWGALTPSTVRRTLEPGRAPSVMMVGTGRNSRSFVAALEGLAEVVKRVPDLLIFCDALAARRAALWAHARRLGLLHNLSLIDEFESRRDLLLMGDILIQPDAGGEQRSILIEAMASGMIVVAAADPFVSILEDRRTARLVTQGDKADWAQVLCDVVENPDAARSLGESARVFIRQERRASDHVRAVLSAYEWLASEQSIPFAEPKGSAPAAAGKDRPPA